MFYEHREVLVIRNSVLTAPQVVAAVAAAVFSPSSLGFGRKLVVY
jgi:hypothetical protein